MEYTIFASKRFIKEFDKLPKDAQKRIKEKLEILKKSPFVGLSLHGSLKGKYRIRVGDYRVIYMVSEKEKRVYLLGVAHRRKVYDV